MRQAEAHAGLPPSPPLPGALQTWLLWRWPYRFLSGLRRQYGSRFTIRALARPPLVFLSDLEDARAVFGASPEVLRPGEGGATIMPIVGEQSFMLADGDQHWRGRTMLAPPFTEAAVREHAAAVREIAEREIARWPRDVPVPLHDQLRALTLRVILHTLLGADECVPALHARLLSMLNVTAGTGLTLPPSRSLPGGRGAWRRFLHDRAEADALISEITADRRAAGGERADVLDLLVSEREEGRPLSDRYVRDSLMSLILAGHETTAAELSWALQLLAHHRHVHDGLVSEIGAGDGGEYLTATTLEVLRHRPVFLFAIPRAVAGPVQIGEWIFDSNAHLLVCIFLIQHDPAVFEAPGEFRPERFLDRRPGASWIPWGGGRKRCPGRRLALLEIETVLDVLLAQATVHPVGSAIERPRWRSVIVTPHAGCRVVLRDRRRARPRAHGSHAVAG